MVRDFTIRRLLLYEHAYVGLVTHFLKYMYKVFTYVISFFLFTSGGFNVFTHCCVALLAYKKSPVSKH